MLKVNVSRDTFDEKGRPRFLNIQVSGTADQIYKFDKELDKFIKSFHFGEKPSDDI